MIIAGRASSWQNPCPPASTTIPVSAFQGNIPQLPEPGAECNADQVTIEPPSLGTKITVRKKIAERTGGQKTWSELVVHIGLTKDSMGIFL